MPNATREPQRQFPAGRFALSQVAGAVVLMAGLLQGAAFAQSASEEDAPLELKPSPRLLETIPKPVREQLPTFMYGDRTSGRPDLETVLEGDAMLRRGDTVVKGDRIEYDQSTDVVKARGNVLINNAGNVFEGPALQLKVDSFEGFFDHPKYQLLKGGGHGVAERADFLDDKRAILSKASYSTCKREPGPGWLPAWVLNATSINIDNEEEEAEAKGAVLRFMDVPVLAFPTMGFPMTDKRKSGVLPPTLALDNLNGVEVTLPYYWNIAPNRDATLYPSVMSKRGVNLGGEFRYLEPTYRGFARADYMPSDKLRDMSRWGIAATHTGIVPTGIPSIGNLGLNINVNRVSDDNYWRDFPRATTSLTQRLLTTEAGLSWGQGNFSTGLRALKYQTLKDVTAPITPPYDRLPQATARYARFDVAGFDFSVDGDYSQFEGDRDLTNQANAKRTFVLGQVSRPFIAPGWFVTPKVQLNATNYQFDAPISNGATSANRTVPTFSLDSGLIFERDASYFGRAYRQTLEPRAFYVYTPFRNQNFLPNYDSGVSDFNFATIYTENAFVGNDRISDSNLLTLGVTTRFLEPNTGAEIARFGIAQRLRYKSQLVTLPGGTPIEDRLSDILVGSTINWTPTWMLDTTIQYNPKTQRSERATIGGRYSPTNYRVLSAAYRVQRDVNQLVSSEQIDIGWQWPLNDLWGDKGRDLGKGNGLGAGRWYSVGRLNYSMVDKKFADSIVGLEYDGDCWIGRVVLERIQRSNQTANKKIMFQIEFIGMSRIGSSPLKTLRDSIPRYQYLREQITTPSRFGSYD